MKKKIFKSALTFISTIFLGALGSAFWELALRPFLALCCPKLLQLYGYFFDSFYKQIASAGHSTIDLASRYFLYFLILCFLIGPKKLLTYFQRLADKIPSYFTYAFCIIFTGIFFSKISCDITANSLNRNIEIVSPYISDTEYKRLKSDLYSITEKEDFEALQNSISDILKENNLL